MIVRHLVSGFNDREIVPEGVLVHFISARYTRPEDPYDPDAIIAILEQYRLAYHELICRDGERIELVPAPLRAWHAGESVWNGRPDCNSWMLGVALAGMYNEPFEDAQYGALVQAIGEHVTRFPTILEQNIVGHEDVAPGRKRDPGPSFEWGRLRHATASLWSPS